MPKPRGPGLWMVGGESEEQVNKEQVLKAEKHLLSLLDDPYYYEAYQRLRRGNHPKLHGMVGRMYEEIGALAKKLQQGMDAPETKKREGPGRPSDPFLEYLKMEEFRNRIESIPGPTLKAKCRAFVKSCRGTDDKQTTEWTNWLYEKVRSNKRNAK